MCTCTPCHDHALLRAMRSEMRQQDVLHAKELSPEQKPHTGWGLGQMSRGCYNSHHHHQQLHLLWQLLKRLTQREQEWWP